MRGKRNQFRHLIFAGVVTSALTFSSLVASPLAHAADDETHSTSQNLVSQPQVQFSDATMSDVKSIIVREEGKIYYRIPAITATPGGDLIASFDERPLSAGDPNQLKNVTTGFNGENWYKGLTTKWKNGEDSPNPNSIIQYRSKDNGETWQKDGYVCQGNPVSNWNEIHGCSDPSYVVDWETGKIFNFHVRSYEAGIQEAVPGNDETNRHVIQVEVSTSNDDGKTWTSKVITSKVTPNKQTLWRFAASGQGIQLTHPDRDGWLVQQFTKADWRGGPQAAFSLISKDHGETWEPGAEVGDKMDENKVVELSNGDLLLTSRDKNGPSNNYRNGDGHRWQAISKDGGFTWSTPTWMPGVTEGKTNGQIIRAFPHAPANDLRSQILLYANAKRITDNNPSGQNNDRSHGTVWMSCDDGKSWPHSKMFNEGSTGYVTITVQHNGRIGMLSEDGTEKHKENGIYYRNFDMDWVGTCPGVKQVIELEKQAEELAKAKQQAEEELARKAEELAQAEQAIEENKAEIAQQQEQIDQLTNDLANANKEIDDAKAQLDKLTTEKTELTEKVTELNAENEKLSEQLAQAEKDKAELEKKLAEAQQAPKAEYPLIPLTPANPIDNSNDEDAQAQSAAPVVSVAHPDIKQGDVQTFTAKGFAPGERVQVRVHSTVVDLGVIAVRDDGSVTVDWTVPADFPTGEHMVEFIGAQRATAQFNVVANGVAQDPMKQPTSPVKVDPSGTSPSTVNTLAKTGLDLSSVLALVVLAVIGGAACLRRPERN
ncbi:exo-alpha-sialidase [Arcanobacterium phocisimile]|uniref:exo-alpha-sialidase n=1 Tax=Arcanobacterium phocisimile TaxID=1302235 RepID=A0ABX7IGF8_9ACTO|nr:exo-alpha-sialidase [Arcanobacterium phocisimile]QRV02203.1 exo-alpha-sialidase [Arcanobacterium phocisimile]